MMALAARRELGGGVRQHPGSNNCVEGAYGIARFDRREPVESDEHARSTCGVRELRRPPVRRSEGQRAAAARRPTSIVCWWRSFVGGERAMLAAPRIGAARRRRRALAPTGHRAAACDQHDTRRHSPPHGDIRVVPRWWRRARRSRPRARRSTNCRCAHANGSSMPTRPLWVPNRSWLISRATPIGLRSPTTACLRCWCGGHRSWIHAFNLSSS